MMAIDVAHEETISRIHIRVAKAKMAITRCWTTVRFSMPNHSVGMFQSRRVTNATITTLMHRVTAFDGWYLRMCRKS